MRSMILLPSCQGLGREKRFPQRTWSVKELNSNFFLDVLSQCRSRLASTSQSHLKNEIQLLISFPQAAQRP